jgi:hypothetical protein
LSAEPGCALVTEFDGPNASFTPITSEVQCALQLTAIVEDAALLTSEVNCGLFITYWPDILLTAEPAAALNFGQGYVGYVASPGTQTVSDTITYSFGATALASVVLTDDGSVYDSTHSSGLVYNTAFYTPLNPAGLSFSLGYRYVRVTVSSGTTPVVQLQVAGVYTFPGVSVWIPVYNQVLTVSVSRDYYTALGATACTGTIEIATDPDGVFIVSTIPFTLTATTT